VGRRSGVVVGAGASSIHGGWLGDMQTRSCKTECGLETADWSGNPIEKAPAADTGGVMRSGLRGYVRAEYVLRGVCRWMYTRCLRAGRRRTLRPYSSLSSPPAAQRFCCIWRDAEGGLSETCRGPPSPPQPQTQTHGIHEGPGTRCTINALPPAAAETIGVPQ
jgi:hypothetical protein